MEVIGLTETILNGKPDIKTNRHQGENRISPNTVRPRQLRFSDAQYNMCKPRIPDHEQGSVRKDEPLLQVHP